MKNLSSEKSQVNGLTSFVAGHIPLPSEKFQLDGLNVERISFEKGHYPWPHWFESVISVIALIVLAPLFLLITLAIKLSSKGDIFYKQIRVGKDGRTFKILKFRTMVVDAEVATGPTLSWKGDPRITRIGRFLRATHLDELPQFLNVMRNEMSFIGPRPERPELTATFISRIEHYQLRESVRPGITGLAQIILPYDATPEQKLNLDLAYILRMSPLKINLQIIYFTIKKMFLRSSYDGSKVRLILNS